MDACGVAATHQHKVVGPPFPGTSIRRCLSQHCAFGPFLLGAAKCPRITRHACQAVHHDKKRPTPAPLDYEYRKATAARTREIVRDRFPELADLADAGTLVCLIRTDKDPTEQLTTQEGPLATTNDGNCGQSGSMDGDHDSAGNPTSNGVVPAAHVAAQQTSAKGRDVLGSPPPAREIYLIGTAHVSRRSARDVKRVVAAVRPDNVVVELCASR